jgi:PAS domain S-box-containing protein
MDTEVSQDSVVPAAAGQFPVGRFLALCVPVAVIVFGTAFAFTDMRFKERLAQIVTVERVQLRQLGSYVAADVSTALVHLQALAGENLVRRALDSRYLRDVQALQTEFAIMARRNTLYQQIRWIDENGSERVRVTREGGHVSVADAGQLQDKSDRYYFKRARSLAIGELYISHLDLNVENHRIELPARPTLRVATPLQDGYGRRRGILIINIEMRRMIDVLASASDISGDTGYSLINQAGYWLTVAGRAPQRESRLEMDDVFSVRRPAAWARISQSFSGYADLEDGLWVWEKLDTDEAIRRAYQVESGGADQLPNIDSEAFSITLVAHIPPGVLAGLHREILNMVILGSVLFMGAYIWGLLFLLGGQLREKRAELETAYAMARAERLRYTSELEKRFRLVVEASGVGMVVVDPEGRIVMSNSTVESMLGYPRGGLKGMSVDSLLPPEQRSHHADIRGAYLEQPEARKMGVGRKLEALTADGRRIPVEVGLNPFRDHGKQLVLASIIDLSSTGNRAAPELQPG